jgi:hypothetical protein|tara:strand:- start:341 stop:1999 length:1659 start_codon:yes stop_codon:yes gene_type:complete
MSSFILEPTEEYDEELGKVVRRRPTPGAYLEHIPNVINTGLGNLIYGPRKEAFVPRGQTTEPLRTAEQILADDELRAAEGLASGLDPVDYESLVSEEPVRATFPPEEVAPEGGFYDEEAAASFPVDAAEQEAAAEYDQEFANAYNTMLRRLMAQARASGRSPESFGYRPEARQKAFDAFEKQALEIQARKSEALEAAKRRQAEAEKQYKEAMDLQGQYKFDQNKAFPSAGSKVAAAIAIALGEAARGFRGGQGQNIGLTLINQSIDREIERQKMEYRKLGDRATAANNLYSRMIQLADSEKSADDLMKAKLTDIAYKQFLSQEKDIQDRNSAAVLNAQMAEARRQADIKAKMSMMTKAREGTLDDKKMLDLVTARDKSRTTIDQIDTAMERIKGLKGPGATISDEELDTVSSRFINVLQQQIRGQDKNMLSAFLSEISKDYKFTKDAYNILDAVAFGLAAEGQSASSISDKDVERFMRVLADSTRSDLEIIEALSPFKKALQRSEAYYSGIIDQGLTPGAASAAAEQLFPRAAVAREQRRRRQQQSGVVKAE